MDEPILELDASGDVLITWVAPNDWGFGIKSYLIEFKISDDNIISSTSCDGTQTSVKDNRQCTIPMEEFF